MNIYCKPERRWSNGACLEVPTAEPLRLTQKTPGVRLNN